MQTIPQEKILQTKEKLDLVYKEVEKAVIGQRYLVERLLMGLCLEGHILVEGVPGLAKTTTVKALASSVDAGFQRIQFTPDLLPADILGTQIYNPKIQEFYVKKGPLFSNIILADEINRAPAKVQSALLEAMQEKQITIGEDTFSLPNPFIVLATQNPIEQEGTYPLPEAQVDRFLFKLKIGYPTRSEELQIMNLISDKKSSPIHKIVHPKDFFEMGDMVREVYMDEKIKDYIVRLVFASREPKSLNANLERYVQFGASPRATIFLNLASKAQALFSGRGYVMPQDIKTMAFDVLRHRILLTFEAEAEGLTTEDIIKKILDRVEVP